MQFNRKQKLNKKKGERSPPGPYLARPSLLARPVTPYLAPGGRGACSPRAGHALATSCFCRRRETPRGRHATPRLPLILSHSPPRLPLSLSLFICFCFSIFSVSLWLYYKYLGTYKNPENNHSLCLEYFQQQTFISGIIWAFKLFYSIQMPKFKYLWFNSMTFC